MIAAARAGRFGQLFLYRAERLDDVPRAMAELVRIAGDRQIVVHDHPRDLTDPVTREAIMAQADAVSRRRQVLSLRYLFVTIRIGASSTGSGVFDPGRIDAIARPITAETIMPTPGLARPQEGSRHLTA